MKQDHNCNNYHCNQSRYSRRSKFSSKKLSYQYCSDQHTNNAFNVVFDMWHTLEYEASCKIPRFHKPTPFQTWIMLRVTEMEDTAKTIRNTCILNGFNLEGIYGIILLRHTILTGTASVEGMETEYRVANLMEGSHLSVKPTTLN